MPSVPDAGLAGHFFVIGSLVDDEVEVLDRDGRRRAAGVNDGYGFVAYGDVAGLLGSEDNLLVLLEDSEAAFGAQLLDLVDGNSDFIEHVTLEDHGFAYFPDEASGELVAILEDDDVGRGSGRLRLCPHGQVEDASTEQARHYEAPDTSRMDLRRFLIGAHPLKIVGWRDRL